MLALAEPIKNNKASSDKLSRARQNNRLNYPITIKLVLVDLQYYINTL